MRVNRVQLSICFNENNNNEKKKRNNIDEWECAENYLHTNKLPGEIETIT